MQKIFFLLFISLISTAAFAQQIEVVPAAPVVITGDLTIGEGQKAIKVKGPWFAVNYEFSAPANEYMTVVGIQEIVTSEDGNKVSYYMAFPEPIEIYGADPKNSGTQYWGGLPAQSNYIYTVEARLVGWMGQKTEFGRSLDARVVFQTQ